ncbi:MAG TPA: hypothetical protein PK177_10500 [Burkholderiaceae bacterium]|nr:hypothetical protein [Burkholderiaceae bacterium]
MSELWLHDVGDDVSREEIQKGCAAATALIASRGLTVDQAYEAVMKRSNRESFDRKAAKAWDDAEDAALGAIFGDIDDWPDDAVLGLAADAR